MCLMDSMVPITLFLLLLMANLALHLMIYMPRSLPMICVVRCFQMMRRMLYLLLGSPPPHMLLTVAPVVVMIKESLVIVAVMIAALRTGIVVTKAVGMVVTAAMRGAMMIDVMRGLMMVIVVIAVMTRIAVTIETGVMAVGVGVMGAVVELLRHMLTSPAKSVRYMGILPAIVGGVTKIAMTLMMRIVRRRRRRLRT